MPFKSPFQEWLSSFSKISLSEDISGGTYRVYGRLSGVRHLTDMCSKNLWNLYYVAHKMWCNLVVYYPCCGDVDIDQLETYGY